MSRAPNPMHCAAPQACCVSTCPCLRSAYTIAVSTCGRFPALFARPRQGMNCLSADTPRTAGNWSATRCRNIGWPRRGAKPMKTISIITPCYNEELNVREVYERVRAAIASLGNYRYEHIFIDNASEDNTVGVLKAIAAVDRNVKV